MMARAVLRKGSPPPPPLSPATKCWCSRARVLLRGCACGVLVVLRLPFLFFLSGCLVVLCCVTSGVAGALSPSKGRFSPRPAASRTATRGEIMTRLLQETAGKGGRGVRG